MNKVKVGHQITTGLLSVLLLMGVGMYLFNYDMVAEMFTSLGFPTFIIYPLAAAKTLAVVALWQKKYRVLTEWAYAGLFFVFILAVSAHISVADGQFGGALIALALLVTSYRLRMFLEKK